MNSFSLGPACGWMRTIDVECIVHYKCIMVERTRVITIRASEDEVAMLHALAEHDGVSSSDLIRLFIRRAYSEKFADKKPRKR